MSCYSELRKVQGEYSPGMIFVENGEGVLVKSSERLQGCGYILADGITNIISGFEELEIGIPVAIAGRVLTYVNDKENIALGDILCAGENGYADKMSEEEIIKYPHRILGEVVEIPTYETYKVSITDTDSFKEIQIRDRVWVKLK